MVLEPGSAGRGNLFMRREETVYWNDRPGHLAKHPANPGYDRIPHRGAHTAGEQ